METAVALAAEHTRCDLEASNCCCCSCSCCCRCLSCFGYQLEDELLIVSLFAHFVPIAEVQSVSGSGALELLFANGLHLERAELLAKLLVASNVPFKWQPGRLHGGQWACQSLRPVPKLWQRMLKAFCNFFIRH